MDRTLVAKKLLHLAKSIQGEDVVAKNVKADNVTYIADAFARFLLGDRNSALRSLAGLTDHDIVWKSNDTEECNQQYEALFHGLYNAIKKNT